MSARPMTRRSLLAATAGVLAGGMMRPGGTLAMLAAPQWPTVWEQSLGRLALTGATIELGRSADLVGVGWRGSTAAGVWLRFRRSGGGWSRWASAGAHGHGPDGPSPSGGVVGDPVWTGGSTAVQLRATRALSGVRLHLVDVSGGVGARRAALRSSPATAAALALATPILAAGPGQPPIVARRAWARGMAPPRVAPEYGAVRMAFVHHTENPNGYAPAEVPAMLRAIYAYHRFARGWNDIGYNFVIDRFGRTFEARAGGIDEPAVGAQAGGYNLVSTGVAILGSFAETPISRAAREALARLLAWKLSLHGLPATGRVTVRVNPAGAAFSKFPANAHVSFARISGHRDADSTDCPGNVLYGELPAIRARARRLAGRPTRATLVLLPATAPAPGAPGVTTAPGGAGTLGGTLEHLDGTPVAGAPIAVQARSVSAKGEVVGERTIAESATDPRGRWSLPITVLASRAGTWLRVLGAGTAGASVSEPLHVAGTVLLSAPGPPPAPPAPSARAAPPPAT
jgi:hypothetical protein